jgi:hypothetical protein
MARRARQHKSTALPIATPWQLRAGLETFRDLMERLDTDPGVAAARQCILDLIKKKGLFPTGLTSVSFYLTYLAYAVVDGVRPRRATYEKLCAEGTGLSYKTLKNSPAQIERMADKIERITAGRFFAVTQLADPGGARQLADLPVNMRLYAAALRTGLEKTPPAYQNPPKVDLTDRVKEWTGTYHYKEVAALLNAADDVINPAEKGKTKDPKFNELMLAKQQSHRRKRQPNLLAT